MKHIYELAPFQSVRGVEDSLSHLLVRTLRPATQSLDGSLGRRGPTAELGSGWWRDATAPTEPEAGAKNIGVSVCACVEEQQRETFPLSSILYRRLVYREKN